MYRSSRCSRAYYARSLHRVCFLNLEFNQIEDAGARALQPYLSKALMPEASC
jgi:hypothetical protein